MWQFHTISYKFCMLHLCKTCTAIWNLSGSSQLASAKLPLWCLASLIGSDREKLFHVVPTKSPDGERVERATWATFFAPNSLKHKRSWDARLPRTSWDEFETNQVLRVIFAITGFVRWLRQRAIGRWAAPQWLVMGWLNSTIQKGRWNMWKRTAGIYRNGLGLLWTIKGYLFKG